VRFDSLIQCKNCKVDVCGGIYLDSNKWTPIFQPRYRTGDCFMFTLDTIILNQTILDQLIREKKVKEITIYACGINREIFGDFGINEIYFIDIIDTVLPSKKISTVFKDDKLLNKYKIQINGFNTICKNIKYLEKDYLSLKYFSKKRTLDLQIITGWTNKL
jgi:hypothetical protein